MLHKYKLNLKYKLSNSWILLIGNGSVTVLNFVFVSILSHNLSPTIYGVYREIFLYANLFVTFCVAGFAQTLYYFLNKRQSNQLNIIGLTRLLLVFIQFVVFVTLLFVVFINPIYIPVKIGYNLLLFILYCFFTTLTLIDVNLAIFYKKHLWVILSNIALLIVKLILLLNLTYLSITSILILSALTQVSVFVINQLLLGKFYWGVISLNKRLNYLTLKQILSYNIPLGLSVLLGFLTANTDRFILSLYNVAPTTFAVLSNVAFEVPFIANIYTSFFTIALPLMITKYNNKDIIGFLNARFSYIKQVTLLVFPIVIGFIIWHNNFILFAFGANYLPLAFLFAIYCINSLMRVCSHIDILLATNNTKYISYIQFVEFFLRLILSYFLFYNYGLNGLIFASVITNCLYVFTVNYISAKLLNVSLVKLFPYQYLVKHLLVIFGLALLIKTIFNVYLENINWLLNLLVYAITVLAWYNFSKFKTKFFDNLFLK